MEDCERKYKEAFNMAVLEHKSDNEAVRESIERIFPQLKESEDEKIRIALISAINNICNSDEGLVTFNGFSKEQVLTWLEKQGGQKSADKCEGCNNAKGCVACVDGSEWAHIEEHNPAWSKEDEEMLRRCISATFDHGYLRECDWLKSLKDRVGCEVNCTTTKAWSEEDERNLQGIIDELEANKHDAPDYDLATYDRFLSWLKSLKEKFVDFDKGFNVGFSAAKYNQWKPSDEQIIALRWVLNNIPYNKHKEEISGLLDQIKEL